MRVGGRCIPVEIKLTAIPNPHNFAMLWQQFPAWLEAQLSRPGASTDKYIEPMVAW